MNQRRTQEKRREEQRKQGHVSDYLRNWVKISFTAASFMTNELHSHTFKLGASNLFISLLQLFSSFIFRFISFVNS